MEGIPHDHAAGAIVAAVIGLAENFDMTCVAEGIENQAQLTYLCERGVLGQGYLLGRPDSGSVINRMLSETRTAGLVAAMRPHSAAGTRDAERSALDGRGGGAADRCSA